MITPNRPVVCRRPPWEVWEVWEVCGKRLLKKVARIMHY
jgi:hypothetical protein